MLQEINETPLEFGVARYIIEKIRDGKDGPEVVERQVVNNLVTTVGKKLILKLAAGLATQLMDAMRIGTSGAAPAAGDTNVKSPIASTRHTASTITMDGQTLQLIFSYISGGGSVSATGIREVAILDSLTSGSDSCISRAVFSAVNKTTTDKLKITYQVKHT